jgi:hypothetical protein
VEIAQCTSYEREEERKACHDCNDLSLSLFDSSVCGGVGGVRGVSGVWDGLMGVAETRNTSLRHSLQKAYGSIHTVSLSLSPLIPLCICVCVGVVGGDAMCVGGLYKGVAIIIRLELFLCVSQERSQEDENLNTHHSTLTTFFPSLPIPLPFLGAGARRCPLCAAEGGAGSPRGRCCRHCSTLRR